MYSGAAFYAGGLFSLIAFVWVTYEVWTNNHRLTKTNKIIWTVAAFFFSFLTAIIYYFAEKRKEVIVS